MNKNNRTYILILICVLSLSMIGFLIYHFSSRQESKIVKANNCVWESKDAKEKIKTIKEIADYLDQMENSQKETFIDTDIDYYTSDTTEDGYIYIGEKLNNGSKRLFKSYRFSTGCDVNFIPFEKDEGQEYLSFTVKVGQEYQEFRDETKTYLNYAEPVVSYYDFNKDGKTEVLVQSYFGSGSKNGDYVHIGGSNLNFFAIIDGKLILFDSLISDINQWQVKDSDSDGYLDVYTYEKKYCEEISLNSDCKKGQVWYYEMIINRFDKSTGKFSNDRLGVHSVDD